MKQRVQMDAMLGELTDNPDEIRAELERIRRENAFVDALLRARNQAGLTQRQLAKRIGVSPAKICRMESGDDASLKIGDIRQYLGGLGISFELNFDDESLPVAEKIKQRVIEIGNLLAKLTSLAEEDKTDKALIDGITKFRSEVLLNFFMRYANTRPQLTIDPSPAPASKHVRKPVLHRADNLVTV